MSKLAKIAKAFPKALGQRVIEDLWGLGFRITIRRADNQDFTDWMEANVDRAQLGDAFLKAELRAGRGRDWRKAMTAEEREEKILENLQTEGVRGISVKDQLPGIRQHLIARDSDGPLAYLDGERLSDKELEDLTTIRYENDGSISRWLPEKDPDTGEANVFGGQAFELAFATWLWREANDLAAFEDKRLETDLGNSAGGRGGGTASTSNDPSASRSAPETSSRTAPGSAPSAGA